MKVYQRYEGLSPIYQGYLTNHLPMLYQILREYQIDDDQMVERLDQYKEARDLYSLTDPLYPTSDFEQLYIQRTGNYLGDIHRYGEDVVIGTVLNEVCTRLHGHLFHGLIRLMYAVRSSNDLLIAQGLSYLSLVSDIDELSARFATMDAVLEKHDSLFETIQSIEIDQQLSTMDRLYQLSEDREIQSNLQSVEYISSKREEVLTWVLNQYKRNTGFYTLHVITGLQALIELEEYFVDFEQAMQSMFIASQIFIAMDKRDDNVPSVDVLEWNTMEENLLELTDVHDIKLVFSLIQLKKLYPLDVLREVASIIYAKQ